jgi:deoxycytidylate deaminase
MADVSGTDASGVGRIARGVDLPRPEIVVGLVGALGTDLGQVQQALQSGLLSVGYQSSSVRVSLLIQEAYQRAHPGYSPPKPVMGALMTQGDELRTASRQGGAAAALAIAEIVQQRASMNERPSHATIIRSLKRPEEVQLLRAVYGPRFVLLGAWSPREVREKSVTRQLRGEHPSETVGWYAQQTAELLLRDEKDAEQKMGQLVRETFELADAYVAIRTGRAVAEAITRLVGLLFGRPYETPGRHEQAMFHADVARLRSSAAGRQVGAVIVDEDGEVLVTGTNDVPRAGGGQYWSGDDPDHRDFRYGFDVNDRQKLDIVNDMFTRLRAAKWLSEDLFEPSDESLAKRALGPDGPLRQSRVGDLLEFGRIAHAEMAAISTAARRGTAIRGTTMYSTTYPCHECARLIIASGINKVIYIDPYPKSQVPDMFQDEVAEGPSDCEGRVVFEPFEGVAPRMFRALFSMTGRERDRVTGEFRPWDPNSASPRLVEDADVTPPIQLMETSAIAELGANLTSAGWRPTEKLSDPGAPMPS